MSIFKDGLIRQGAAGAAGDSVYSIDQSIRFNKADSAYMSRTVGSGGNTKTWSFSVWFKLGLLGSQRGASPFLWACHQSDSNRLQLSLDSGSLGAAGDFLSIYNNTGSGSTIFRLSKKLRDPSAWYHLVLVADTSNSVATDRFRVYLNGQRETSFSTFNAPSLNADLGWNQNGSTYYLGDYFSTHNGTYSFDGYMAEINHVDGYAYGPEYFGEFKSGTDIWIPKEYTGSYGTKGFFIDGRDSSDLGDDESGNGNDFTVSGLAAHDQVADSPTNNFCVLNQISIPTYGGNFNRGVAQTNLAAYNAGGAETYAIGSMAFSSGKWYWEFYTTSYPAGNGIVYGITEQDYWEANGSTSHSYIGRRAALSERHTTSAYSYWAYSELGNIGNGLDASGLTPFQQSVVVGVAVDMSTNIITFTTNGSSYATKDFDTYSYAFGSKAQFPVWRLLGATTLNINFGQDSTFNGQVTAGGNSDDNGIGNFKYSVPSGYLALCTKNLGS